jgi:hypothetical protein
VPDLPDPNWYVDNVLVFAEPGRADALTDLPLARWRAWWQDQWRRLGSDPVGTVAREQGFVIASRQLREIGLSRDDARREVRRGRLWMPARGIASPVVVPGDDWEARRRRHAITACAAALSRPDHVVDGRSAAILYGLPTVRVPVLPELTTGAPTSLGRRARAHVFGAALKPWAMTRWFGTWAATPVRTVVDLARRDRWDGLMAADAALREGLFTLSQVLAATDVAIGWPGVRQARSVLSLASPQAESPLESITRLRLHDDGFPVPEMQVEVPDPQLDRVYRLDLLLRAQRLAIEADGKDKYTDDELWREKKRESRVRRLTDYRTERVIWTDVGREWPATRTRLRQAAGL